MAETAVCSCILGRHALIAFKYVQYGYGCTGVHALAVNSEHVTCSVLTLNIFIVDRSNMSDCVAWNTSVKMFQHVRRKETGDGS